MFNKRLSISFILSHGLKLVRVGYISEIKMNWITFTYSSPYISTNKYISIHINEIVELIVL